VKRRIRPVVETRRLRGHDLALGIVAQDAEAVVVGDAAAGGIEQRQDGPPRLRIGAIDVDQVLHRRKRQRDAALARGRVGLEEQAAEQVHRPVLDHDVGEQRPHQLGRRYIRSGRRPRRRYGFAYKFDDRRSRTHGRHTPVKAMLFLRDY